MFQFVSLYSGLKFAVNFAWYLQTWFGFAERENTFVTTESVLFFHVQEDHNWNGEWEDDDDDEDEDDDEGDDGSDGRGNISMTVNEMIKRTFKVDSHFPRK